MESGNRTADKMAKAYVENHPDSEVRRMYGHHVRSYRDGYIAASQQCEALQSENDLLGDRLTDAQEGENFWKNSFEERTGDWKKSVEENTRLLERVKELTEALRSIEPFAVEVVSRQTNESVFGYNSQMLTLSSLKKIIAALNPKE
jgi:hypothetical protein